MELLCVCLNNNLTQSGSQYIWWCDHSQSVAIFRRNLGVKTATRQRQGSDKAATRQPAISLDQVFVYVQSVINQNDWGEAGNIAKRGDLSPSAHSFSSLPTSYVLTCDRLQSKCNIATCWQSVFINYAAIICKPLSATELDRLETTRRTVQPPLQPEVQHPQPLCEQLVAAG